MKEECLLCGAPLEYLTRGRKMECALCHKKEWSKSRCIKGHFICNQCHTKWIDQVLTGGACGFWGACGAGISTGMSLSILSNATPLSKEPLGLSNQMTARALDAIGTIGGPRCCKRNSYLSLLAAAAFVEERFHLSMPVPAIRCAYAGQNNQSLGKVCPFSPGS